MCKLKIGDRIGKKDGRGHDIRVCDVVVNSQLQKFDVNVYGSLKSEDGSIYLTPSEWDGKDYIIYVSVHDTEEKDSQIGCLQRENNRLAKEIEEMVEEGAKMKQELEEALARMDKLNNQLSSVVDLYTCDDSLLLNEIRGREFKGELTKKYAF